MGHGEGRTRQGSLWNNCQCLVPQRKISRSVKARISTMNKNCVARTIDQFVDNSISPRQPFPSPTKNRMLVGLIKINRTSLKVSDALSLFSLSLIIQSLGGRDRGLMMASRPEIQAPFTVPRFSPSFTIRG